MSRWLLLVLASALSAAHPAGAAQDIPNLTGTWRMVAVTGDRDRFGIPDSRITVIEQKGPTIRVHVRTMRAGTPAEQAYTYATDGSERVDSVGGGGTIRSRARWDGAVLAVQMFQTTPAGGTIEVEDRYELSPDRRTLTIRRTMIRNGVPATIAMEHAAAGRHRPGRGRSPTAAGVRNRLSAGLRARRRQRVHLHHRDPL